MKSGADSLSELSAPFQSVKEPLLLLGKNWGFGVFRCKYAQYLREKGVVPTPLCQLF